MLLNIELEPQNLFIQFACFLQTIILSTVLVNELILNIKMSQSSLHIAQISSRTFNNDSIMQTSMEQIASPFTINKYALSQDRFYDRNNKAPKKVSDPSWQQLYKLQKKQNEQYKSLLEDYGNRLQHLGKGNSIQGINESQFKQFIKTIDIKDQKYQQLQYNYKKSIQELKETVQKNQLLFREVQRLNKKLSNSQLTYSRQHQVLQKSQNVISNLSLSKSNYEIQLVNLKDSLVIMEKENRQIAQTNDVYEQKIVLITQEVERLRNVLQNTRNQNQKLKSKIQDVESNNAKWERENRQLKKIIERTQLQYEEQRQNVSTLTMQLHEYHEKMVNKETVITDYQVRENKIALILKEKERQYRQLQAQVSEANRRIQQEKNNRKDQSFNSRELNNQINQLRIYLNEANHQAKIAQIQQVRLNQQYNSKVKDCETIQSHCQQLIEEKNNLNKEKQLILKEIYQMQQEMGKLKTQKDSELKIKQSLILSLQQQQSTGSMQKDRDLQFISKRYQQRQQSITRDYQYKIDLVNKQKVSEINTINTAFNQCRYQLDSKLNQLNQYKSQLIAKNTEISLLKQERISKNNIRSVSYNDIEGEMRIKNDMIHDLRTKLSNYERLMEQNRKEKDMIFQQKNTISLQTIKCQQIIQLKENELKNSLLKIQELDHQLKETFSILQEKHNSIQIFQQVINDHQLVIKQINRKLNEREDQIKKLMIECERLAKLLQEKDGKFNQLKARYNQAINTMEQRKREIINIKNNNDSLNFGLRKAEQSKNNIGLLLKQIQNLNGIIFNRQKEIRMLRQGLNTLVQKINIIGQDQLKIINILQLTSSQDQKKQIHLGNYFEDVKEFMKKLSQNTGVILTELSKQNISIQSQLTNNQVQLKKKCLCLQKQLEESHIFINKRNQQIKYVQQQLEDIKIKQKHIQSNNASQAQIFQKILQLTRQNASIREHMAHIKAQHQQQIQIINYSNAQQLARANQQTFLQSRQLEKYKMYIQQIQIQLSQALHQGKGIDHLTQSLQQKQTLIQELKISKEQLERNMFLITASIDARVKQFQVMANNLSNNGREIETYRQIIKKYQNSHPSKLFKDSKSDEIIQVYVQQIRKLQNIIQIRNNQLAKNQQSYFNINQERQSLLQQMKGLRQSADKLRQSEQKCLQYEYRLQQIEQDKNQLEERSKSYEEVIDKLENTIAQIDWERKNELTNSNRSNLEIIDLKRQNKQLSKHVQKHFTKIQQSEANLAMANQQINVLQKQLYQLLESNSQFLSKYEQFEVVLGQKDKLMERIHRLEDEVEEKQQTIKLMEFQMNYLIKKQEEVKLFIHNYKGNNSQLQRQGLNLKDTLSDIQILQSKDSSNRLESELIEQEY